PLDAGHDVRQVRLGDLVVRLPPILLALEQAAALHEAQVFGGHVAGDAARLGKLPDRVAAPQEHLDHPQPVRVGQRLEAFRRLLQRLQGGERGQLRGLGRGGHRGPPILQYIGRFRFVKLFLRFFRRACRPSWWKGLAYTIRGYCIINSFDVLARSLNLWPTPSETRRNCSTGSAASGARSRPWSGRSTRSRTAPRSS